MKKKIIGHLEGTWTSQYNEMDLFKRARVLLETGAKNVTGK